MKFTSISNMKIGSKIGLVLGGNLLTLMLLSGLSLWGLHTSERMMSDMQDRFTKAQLVETVAHETSALGQSAGRLMAERKATDEIVNEIMQSRKARLAALQEFKSIVHTPPSIKQAAELSDLVAANAAANDTLIAALRAGKYADAARCFQVSTTVSEKVRAKAREALEWQARLSAEHNKTRREQASLLFTLLIAGSILAAASAAYFGFLLTRVIAKPLAAAVVQLDQIAKGDLSKDSPAELLARGDEIGILTRAMQGMTVALRHMVQEIASGIQVLSSSSTELMASSTEMTSGSRHASDKANLVAAASEEMSTNITSVAAGMEETTTNLAHVASATEQMTSTIAEIAQNSEKARRITDQATVQAARVTEQINQLGEAAREIGKVTETITEISSQTNLLALNATIEAARAGSAGKGFAVVATEIKALAQQTAAATEDIKGRIEGVQAATAGGIVEIGKVSQVIHDVSEIVASIAAAIEEQSTATKDISRNIAEASVGLSDANTRVAETSQASREIAKDIVGIDTAAGAVAGGSEQVRTSAAEVIRVSEQLQSTVVSFRISRVDQSAIKSALTAHAGWTSRLKGAIANRKLDVPVSTIRADNQCHFGKWLYGAQLSAAEKQTEHYISTRRLHAQFHEAASHVAQLAVSGQSDAAEKAMGPGSEYVRVSTALTGALNDWSTAL